VTTCALCFCGSPLRVSHIVPHFVVAGMRANSITGFLRSFDQPNVRLQDAFKVQLLCESCEQQFSRWEDRIARTVFVSARRRSNTAITYDSDFSRFVVSVLWRVLVWRSEAFLCVSPEFKAQLEFVEREWRCFLLGEATTPGRATCHAVILGQNPWPGSKHSASLGAFSPISGGHPRHECYQRRS